MEFTNNLIGTRMLNDPDQDLNSWLPPSFKVAIINPKIFALESKRHDNQTMQEMVVSSRDQWILLLRKLKFITCNHFLVDVLPFLGMFWPPFTLTRMFSDKHKNLMMERTIIKWHTPSLNLAKKLWGRLLFHQPMVSYMYMWQIHDSSSRTLSCELSACIIILLL